jgi:hypothetical protein
MKVLGFR